LLQQLKGPIEITSYARPGDLRTRTRLLIDRYQRFKHDIALKFVDPDADPVATQDANITTDGESIVTWNNRTQHVTQVDEPGFSDALVRLARGGNKLVAFITGDGERDATGKNPADLGAFVQRLSTRGLRASKAAARRRRGRPDS